MIVDEGSYYRIQLVNAVAFSLWQTDTGVRVVIRYDASETKSQNLPPKPVKLVFSHRVPLLDIQCKELVQTIVFTDMPLPAFPYREYPNLFQLSFLCLGTGTTDILLLSGIPQLKNVAILRSPLDYLLLDQMPGLREICIDPTVAHSIVCGCALEYFGVVSSYANSENPDCELVISDTQIRIFSVHYPRVSAYLLDASRIERVCCGQMGAVQIHGSAKPSIIEEYPRKSVPSCVII